MLRFKSIVVMVFTLLFATVSLAGANMLYMTTNDGGTSVLYTVTTGGTATRIGTIKAGGSNVSISDIAYNPVDHKMYAISSTDLYTLDFLHPSGGNVTATDVGNTGVTLLKGLGVAANGTIYAGSNHSGSTPGSLYTLSAANGAATGVGTNFGTNYLGIFGDLAFSSGGDLYGMFYFNTGSINYLGTVNVTSGVATRLPNGTGKDTADGLAFINTTLYGTYDQYLITLNTSTGSIINQYKINYNGEDLDHENGLTYYYPGTPLPPSALLLGTGLMVLVLWRGSRRKRGIASS